MKHRDTSFSLIFGAVVLAHVGFIAWLLMGPAGCQQELTALEALTPDDPTPIQLNLTLGDRLKTDTSTDSTQPSLPPRATPLAEDPESRLVLPKAPVAVTPPPPDPIVVDDSAEKEREAAKQKALLAEQRKRAEEAEARIALLEKEKLREAEAQKKRELAATKTKRAAEVKQRQRELAKQQVDAELVAKAKLEKERHAARLAKQRLAKAAEVELEREIERKREDQRLAVAKRDRRIAAAAKQRQADEARILSERLERERAASQRIERAKVVGQPSVVKAKTVGGGESSGQAATPSIVRAKPTGAGGGKPAPITVDMIGYRESVQKMIRNRWDVPKGIAANRRPEVILRINRAGKVVYSRLSQKSGNPNLDRSAINAVQIGARLIPLPPGYDKGLYEVKVKFEID